MSAERPIATVVSALAGTTDQLLGILSAALDEPRRKADWGPLRRRHRALLEALLDGADSKTAVDPLAGHFARLAEIVDLVRESGRLDDDQRVEVLATGERLAAAIMVAACDRSSGGSARVELVDPGDLLVADGALDEADVDLRSSMERYPVVCGSVGLLWVVPGFFARGHDHRLRLLGRGGSDTTATMLGAVLDADRVEIWTDVDGVYPEDPRTKADQLPFGRLSYDEAERLARRGAEVLHAKSIAPARTTGIPVWVRNSFRPAVLGTWIAETETVVAP